MSEYNDDIDIEVDGVDSIDIEVEDDTPEADRNRAPMPKELVEELEADELEDYSDKVKTRLKQMKKVWHDERREKEQASRERQEAITVAQNMYAENQRLKQSLHKGEENLVHSYKQSTELEAAEARREYKQAYEAGDSDALVQAQEKLASANYKLEQLKGYRPTLQEEQPVVQQVQDSAPIPRPDRKTMAWQERNSWWGVDPEMTASALGLHQKLEKQNGANYVGTDEYWNSIDNTMRRRFPEYFGDNDTPTASSTRTSRPATVVAPASRSTSSKKVVLKQSQIQLAKKLGLTAEQYAREFVKMEK